MLALLHVALESSPVAAALDAGLDDMLNPNLTGAVATAQVTCSERSRRSITI
jgi:hypothetical protein